MVPVTSGIHKSENDKQVLKQSAARIRRDVSLLYEEEFHAAWVNACASAVHAACVEAQTEEHKLKKLMNRHELDHQIPNIPDTIPQKYSAGVLAFVQVKVIAKLWALETQTNTPGVRTVARQSPASGMNIGHQGDWCLALLDICKKAS